MFLAAGMMLAGCKTGMLAPRTGELFQTTRQGPGSYFGPCMWYGRITPVLGWVTLIPAGIVTAAVDVLVVSPAIDLVCLPYDLMQPNHGFTIRVCNEEGEPVKGAKVSVFMATAAAYISGDFCEETDENGEIYFSKLNHVELLGITIEKDGYCRYSDYSGWLKIDDVKPDAEGRLALNFVMKREPRPVEKGESEDCVICSIFKEGTK